MSDTKEFKNDHLTVSVVEEPGCVVKFDVTITPEATKAAYLKAIKSINKEVSLPGFRKGRAPDELVLTHYKKYVEDEWKDILLNTAFSESIDLVKMYPLNKNTMKQPQVKSISKDDGSRFTIEFEKAPQVPDVDPTAFKLPQIEAQKVTEKEVNEFIEQMRLRVAKWNDVEDREIQDGDFVDLDIESLDEPGLQICGNTRFEYSKKMAKWMHKLLKGAKVGTQVEGVSEKDAKEHACDSSCSGDHHHHHDDEFKPTHCRITVKAIKQPELPALDEEFAKKVSSESIEKLHENAQKKLEQDAIVERDDKIKESIKKQIEDLYTFEVPRSFVSSNRPEEAAQMRLFFVTSEFAKKHHISVDNNEIYQAAMQEVMTRGDLADDLMNGDERRVDSARAALYTNLLIEKVLNKIMELATEASAK